MTSYVIIRTQKGHTGTEGRRSVVNYHRAKLWPLRIGLRMTSEMFPLAKPKVSSFYYLLAESTFKKITK